VNTYFKTRASEWEEIYARKDVYAVIHQLRQALVLQMIDSLGLSSDEEILDIGCGAGLTTAAVAARGYTVEAVDSVEEMLDLTRRHAAEAAVAHRVKTALADVNHLRFPNSHFGLVLAIGVLPWVSSLSESMRAVARITKPDGYLIVTVDNRWRLHEFLDPRLNPLHAPIRRVVRALCHRKDTPPARRHSSAELDTALRKLGYAKLHGVMLGFGPFSLFGRKILPERIGVKAHNALQHYADRNVPILRSTGAQYLVLARKQK
jgi:ubiquinone/menaquinone biosynthesis C-methylase UbiE